MITEAPIVDEIVDLFAARGNERYSEAVSQTEYALQSARLAETAGGDSALIVAAMLHDIGHLLQKVGVDAAERGIDDVHEAIGAGWLARRFGPDVAEPVRLHVAAKRYLCAVEPRYNAILSPASVRSLALQGGPMSPAEAEAFAAGPHHTAALCLRRWDDEAKVPDLATPGFDHFRRHIEVVARSCGRGGGGHAPG
jgi:phosphonate degradation associated HDIG domain protein